MLLKLWAFLWKDYLQAKSYRLTFVAQFGGLFFTMAGLFFMNRLLGSVELPQISEYGGNYVAYLLTGIVITLYSATALKAFSGGIRQAQLTGTLEPIMLTRTGLPTIVMGWSLYPFLRTTATMVVYLTGGFLIIELPFRDANIAGLLATAFLTVLVMGGLGLLAASFTLVFKQGDPFTSALMLASGMLSGTLYPVSVLPSWLQPVSVLLPQTHAIEAMRLSVLQGGSIETIAPQLGALALFAAVIIPAGIFCFSYAIRIVKAEGSIAQY